MRTVLLLLAAESGSGSRGSRPPPKHSEPVCESAESASVNAQGSPQPPALSPRHAPGARSGSKRATRHRSIASPPRRTEGVTFSRCCWSDVFTWLQQHIRHSEQEKLAQFQAPNFAAARAQEGAIKGARAGDAMAARHATSKPSSRGASASTRASRRFPGLRHSSSSVPTVDEARPLPGATPQT